MILCNSKLTQFESGAPGSDRSQLSVWKIPLGGWRIWSVCGHVALAVVLWTEWRRDRCQRSGSPGVGGGGGKGNALGKMWRAVPAWGVLPMLQRLWGRWSRAFNQNSLLYAIELGTLFTIFYQSGTALGFPMSKPPFPCLSSRDLSQKAVCLL